jgi:hypothetical protein
LSLLLTVDEALDIAFGPFWLWWYGKVDVGDVGSLEQWLSARGAVFANNHDSAEA